MINEKKIVIEGSFWDSYIYSNNLLLFGRDQTIKSYNWDSFVNSHISNPLDLLAYRCAFYQSDFLYGVRERQLFSDPEIKELILDKFNRIESIYVSEQDLSLFKTFKTPIELPHLTIDIGVFKNKLYYCDSDGLFVRQIRNNTKTSAISSRMNKFWDAYIQCLKVSKFGRIALSASSDGLFELNTTDYDIGMYEEFKPIEEDIFQLTNEHSSYSCWAFSSILNGSYVGNTRLFGFRYISNNMSYDSERETGMNFMKSYDMSNLFTKNDPSAIIISENEKIYQLSSDMITGVEYNQSNLGTNEEIFTHLFSKEQNFEAEIVDAAVAEFGIVIETKTKLYVLLSTGEEIYTVNKNQEDIIRWRVFPRSTCYVNQLHVIYNNRIEIISFNDDYFVDQKHKQIGNRFVLGRRFYSNK